MWSGVERAVLTPEVHDLKDKCGCGSYMAIAVLARLD